MYIYVLIASQTQWNSGNHWPIHIVYRVNWCIPARERDAKANVVPRGTSAEHSRYSCIETDCWGDVIPLRHFLYIELYLKRFANAQISIELHTWSNRWELHGSSILKCIPATCLALGMLATIPGREMIDESAERRPWAAMSREIDLCWLLQQKLP